MTTIVNRPTDEWARYGKLTGLYSLTEYVERTSHPYGGRVVATIRLPRTIVEVKFRDVATAAAWLEALDNSEFEYLNDPHVTGDLRDPVRSLTDSAVVSVTAEFRPKG